MRGLRWSGCFVVSVVQKFVPLWLICNWASRVYRLSLLELLRCLTCLAGCLGGLGVLSFRTLLGYSSLVHLGLLIILCCVSLVAF